MSPLMASAPPLLAPSVVKYPRNASDHCFRVRPRRATSGIGHEVNESLLEDGLDAGPHRVPPSAELPGEPED